MLKHDNIFVRLDNIMIRRRRVFVNQQIINITYDIIARSKKKKKQITQRRKQQISVRRGQGTGRIRARVRIWHNAVGAMGSAELARCHITAEHNVLSSYRYTNPEPSVFFFFLARTSLSLSPSPHIAHIHRPPSYILHCPTAVVFFLL